MGLLESDVEQCVHNQNPHLMQGNIYNAGKLYETFQHGGMKRSGTR